MVLTIGMVSMVDSIEEVRVYNIREEGIAFPFTVKVHVSLNFKYIQVSQMISYQILVSVSNMNPMSLAFHQSGTREKVRGATVHKAGSKTPI